MAWKIIASHCGDDTPPESVTLQSDSTAYIVTTADKVSVVHELSPGLHRELGRISVGPWGVKLEAVEAVLKIATGQNQDSTFAIEGAPIEGYELRPSKDQKCEILLLRAGDVITSPAFDTRLACRWDAPIQVPSSAVEMTMEGPEANHSVNGVAETPGDETDDEGTKGAVSAIHATQSVSQAPRATPQLSSHRSIVQETPTAIRVNAIVDTSVKESLGSALEAELESRPPTPDQTEAQTFSTARSGQSQSPVQAETEIVAKDQLEASETAHSQARNSEEQSLQKSINHPRVVISSKTLNKRLSPAPDAQNHDLEDEIGDDERPSKRTKKSAKSVLDTQDNRLSNIGAENNRNKTPKRKYGKRKSDMVNRLPLEPQEISQTAGPAPGLSLYDGDLPRVCFSKSAIASNSQVVKFLKKHGGHVVESIKDKCNVLCIRDGVSLRTPKMFESIAYGIPIVIDKWLLDSAKANQFLSLEHYKPTITDQETEWNFELEHIWQQPQKPFEGYTVRFTTELKKAYPDFSEIKDVCEAAGGKVATKKKLEGDRIIILAKEEGDKESESFMQEGWTCFARDLLTHSILRGKLDLESDEFKIIPIESRTTSDPETRKRKGRKS